MTLETLNVETQARDLEEIKARCGYAAGALTLGDVVIRDVDRYHSLLRDARRPLRGRFSSAELMLIVDSNNGTIFTPGTARGLALNVEDSVGGDGLAEKWAVDGPALVAKLQGLGPVETLALVDAVERFWSNPRRYTNGGDVTDLLS